MLVTAVEAHRLAEKTCADADPNAVFHALAPCKEIELIPSIA
jgi:hypothetical protein